MSKKDYEEAMEELDQIEKSIADDEDSLDALTKALEDELADDLAKSGDDGECTEAECCKKDCYDECDKKGCCNHGKDCCFVGMDKSESCHKSQDEIDVDELIKASELYASLEKSVKDGIGDVFDQMDALRKSMAALMNLNIKQAKVIAGLAKSMDEQGARPVAPGRTVLGLGSDGDDRPLTKSNSEIKDDLLKAIQEGKVASIHLSAFETYKDVNRLPAEVRDIIGV